MDTKYWLGVCNKIGESAFEEMKKHFENIESKKVVGNGSGGDKTMIVDDAIEKILLKEIEKTGKSVKIISEEFGEKTIGNKPEILMVVDPLDGSNNFKFGIPFNCISIAVGGLSEKIEDTEIGYVKDFVKGDTYHAIKGKGAWKNDKKIFTNKEDTNCLFVDVVLKNEKDFRRIVNVGKKFPYVRMLGSACLAMCFAAEGIIDGYIILGAGRTIDFTATQLIVKEAGGIVKDLDGKDLTDYDIGFEIKINLIAASNETKFRKIKSVLVVE